MKTLIFTLLSAGCLMATSCTGKKADEANADSSYKYTDTSVSTIDTNSKDSVHTKMLADSTTNAPKMPGGN